MSSVGYGSGATKIGCWFLPKSPVNKSFSPPISNNIKAAPNIWPAGNSVTKVSFAISVLTLKSIFLNLLIVLLTSSSVYKGLGDSCFE